MNRRNWPRNCFDEYKGKSYGTWYDKKLATAQVDPWDMLLLPENLETTRSGQTTVLGFKVSNKSIVVGKRVKTTSTKNTQYRLDALLFGGPGTRISREQTSSI